MKKKNNGLSHVLKAFAESGGKDEKAARRLEKLGFDMEKLAAHYASKTKPGAFEPKS